MQKPSEHKREAIFNAAAHLFATRPFHEVRLEDIAQEAHVGKGTLYVYFKSKETLYLALVRNGFQQLVKRLRERLSPGPDQSVQRLGIVAGELVAFAFTLPDLYRVMRTRILTPEDPELQEARRELAALIESVLREGNDRGEFDDPRPDMTAQYMLSFVRGVLLYPPPDLTPDMLRDHLVRVIHRGIAKGVCA